MKLEHWWNYEEGVAGERQANREEQQADETQVGCSREKDENERGDGVKSGRGFDDSSEWVFDSQGPERPGNLPLCAPLHPTPLHSTPHSPHLLPSPPPPEPSQLRAAAPVVACSPPLPEVGDNMLSPPPTLSHRMKIAVARPSPCPSSPPPAGIAVAVTSRPPRLGKVGGGERGKKKKKSQENVNCACARAVAGPQTGN